MLLKFAKIISEIKPDIISMENVPSVQSHLVFHEFINTIYHLGYFFDYKIVNAAEYGVPQKRHRMVLLGSLLGDISLIPPLYSEGDFLTVKDAIYNMESLNSGQQSKEDSFHICSNLSKENKLRMELTPYGGSWIDWPEENRLECQKRGKWEIL